MSFPGHASLEISSPGTLSNVLPTTLPRSSTAGRSWAGSTNREPFSALRIAAFSARLLPPWLPVTAGSSAITCRWRWMSWCSMS